MTIDVRPAGQRFHTDIGWLDSWHSFSFADHYDPANVGHGQLLVLNDDRVAPASGFGTHAHRDMEIVTWVLEGTLEHRDSEGNHGVLYPGLAQRMSAGSGIRHSEMNPDPDLPVHFLQMWVMPDTTGIDARLRAAGPVATGSTPAGWCRSPPAPGTTAPSPSTSATPPCGWHAWRPVTPSPCPRAPHVHVFVARGAATLEGVDRPARPG